MPLRAATVLAPCAQVVQLAGFVTPDTLPALPARPAEAAGPLPQRSGKENHGEAANQQQLGVAAAAAEAQGAAVERQWQQGAAAGEAGGSGLGALLAEALPK